VTYASPEFVVPLRRRTGPLLVFLFVLLYGVWFTVVILGEQQAWTDDPGTWSYLKTDVWAWGGLVLFGLATIYFILLLVRREAPSKTYTAGPSEGAAPGFLQSTGAAAPEGKKADAEAHQPPQS